MVDYISLLNKLESYKVDVKQYLYEFKCLEEEYNKALKNNDDLLIKKIKSNIDYLVFFVNDKIKIFEPEYSEEIKKLKKDEIKENEYYQKISEQIIKYKKYSLLLGSKKIIKMPIVVIGELNALKKITKEKMAGYVITKPQYIICAPNTKIEKVGAVAKKFLKDRPDLIFDADNYKSKERWILFWLMPKILIGSIWNWGLTF